MQPSFFISHGAPDVAITPSPVRDFLINFGKEHPRPDAIIIASAQAGMPARPSRTAIGPSFITPPAASAGSSGCWITSPSKVPPVAR